VRWLAIAHAVALGALGIACAVAWRLDDGAFLAGVLGATDVATRKGALTGAAPAMPPWAAFRPLVGAAALALLAGAGVLGVAAAARARRLAAGATVLTTLALLPSVAGALGLVSVHRGVKVMAEAIGRRAGPRDVVVHEGPIENAGALEWYSGRRPVIVDGRRSVLGFAADRPEARAAFWDDATLARAWSSPGRVWLLTGRPPERSVIARLGHARLVGSGGGRRLYVNQ
jgi:hypothetical protein